MKLCIVWTITVVLMMAASSIGSTTVSPVTANTTISMDGPDNIAQKYIAGSKALKKAFSTIIRNMLPHIVRSNGDLNISSECSRGILKFLIGFKQTKTWAFRMFDAFGKLPNGMVSGTINTLGDYDQCLDTVVPGHFQPQYCLVEFSPVLPAIRSRFVSYNEMLPEFVNVTDSDSITTELMRTARFFYHLNFRSAICVPSTCSKEEVLKMTEKVIQMTGLGFYVSVPNCETKVEKIVLSNGDIAIVIVLSLILILALTATVTDVYLKITSHDNAYQKNLNMPMKCLICFSFYTNGQRILKKDDNPDSIKIFHGMKVITILWVILNHTYLYLNYQALSSLLLAPKTGKEITFQLIVNGFVNVQTFFFISAVLVAYGVMKMKGKRINIFLYAFRRFWRLTPPFMFVIACIFLLPHLGSGPVWKETVVDGLTEKCKNYWWSNLLYFNNFISKADTCIDWTWYIPVDTHLYFVSLLVLIPLKRNVKLAFIINGALLVLGIILTAATHIYYKLQPTAIYVYMHPDDINYFVERGYYRSYLHISSYSVGMTVGYILATKQKMRISKTVNIIGWCTAFILSLSVVYGVYDWNQGNVPGMFVSTLYACTNKLVWSLALAWVTISCMTGNGGFATSILSWNAFVPLGRLTYMVYLVHPIIQFVYIGSTRTVIRPEHRTLVFMYCGNVVLGFMVACVFSLLFESPFMALEKVMFSSMNRKVKHDSRTEGKNTEEINAGSRLKFQTSDSINDQLDHNIYTINFKQIAHDC